jgi:hypothetical protein
LGIQDSASLALAAGIYRTLRFHKVARDLDPAVSGEVARRVTEAKVLDARAMDREASATGASAMRDSAVSIAVAGTAADGTVVDGMVAATTFGSWEICSAWRWTLGVWP